MSILSQPIDERIACLRELLECNGNLFSWTYDPEGTLLDASSEELVLNTLFSSTGSMQYMLEYSRSNHAPLILSIPYNLVWSAVFETKDDEVTRIHVFGPFSTRETLSTEIRRAIARAQVPRAWLPKLMRNLERIPTIMVNQLFQYTLMLHYCVAGERLSTGDIHFQRAELASQKTADHPKGDRMQTYMAERALLKMVREGDPNYKAALSQASSISGGVGIQSSDSLTQAKISASVFTSLCTRAAIEGGISPEAAYSRGDAYIQDLIECHTMTDVVFVNHKMYEDFIMLVRKSRINPHWSKQIQSCCDYIELHSEEKLTLSFLAGRIGYANYYLSRKFKEETGVSINTYIKIVRVERAKMLLTTTQLSIQEISERLCFGTRSFFDDTFKKITGVAPAAYRAQNQKL